ncbi:LOW QUALITY PROTEIN: motilin receptor [Thomomys bottae]
MGSPWNSSVSPGGAEEPEARWPQCAQVLGLPPGALVPVTAACLGLFAVGVSGNVVTVLLIGRSRDMRTTPNLYLGSMAVSDLLIWLGFPFDLYRLWRPRPWVLGPLLWRRSLYLGEGGTYATLLHATALSDKSYLAVCRPLCARALAALRARALAARRRGRAFLWATALLSAGPFFFLVGVEQDPGVFAIPDGSDTFMYHPSPPIWSLTSLGSSGSPPLSSPSGPAEPVVHPRVRAEPRAQLGALRVMLWVTTAYFSLPFLCLSLLYGLIGRELWKNRGPRGGGERGHRQTVRVLRDVLALIMCWLPFHIARIIYINTEDSNMMYQYLSIVALQLFYLIASIDLILYNLISKKYRAAVYKFLFARESRQSGLGGSRDTGRDAGGDTAGYTETGANTKMMT